MTARKMLAVALVALALLGLSFGSAQAHEWGRHYARSYYRHYYRPALIVPPVPVIVPAPVYVAPAPVYAAPVPAAIYAPGAVAAPGYTAPLAVSPYYR